MRKRMLRHRVSSRRRRRRRRCDGCRDAWLHATKHGDKQVVRARERKKRKKNRRVFAHSLLSGFKTCASFTYPSMSPLHGSSYGGYTSSQYAGSVWDHNNWQPKKWDKEHCSTKEEWKCTVCGEGNFFDRTRCKGCTQLASAEKDSGKGSQGKGVLVNQEANQRYTARKDESRNTGITSNSRKTIDIEQKVEKMQGNSAEAQQTTETHSTTDNRRQTGMKKKINTLEEDLEVVKTSLQPRKYLRTAGRIQRVEPKSEGRTSQKTRRTLRKQDLTKH